MKHKLSRFKDPVSYLCLAGYVVTSWSPTQDIAGLNNLFLQNFYHRNQQIQKKAFRETEMGLTGQLK